MPSSGRMPRLARKGRTAIIAPKADHPPKIRTLSLKTLVRLGHRPQTVSTKKCIVIVAQASLRRRRLDFSSVAASQYHVIRKQSRPEFFDDARNVVAPPLFS